MKLLIVLMLLSIKITSVIINNCFRRIMAFLWALLSELYMQKNETNTQYP